MGNSRRAGGRDPSRGARRTALALLGAFAIVLGSGVTAAVADDAAAPDPALAAASEAQVTEQPVVEEPVAEPPAPEVVAPEPEAPAPPVVEEPAVEQPVVEPPVAEPPVTEPPVTEPPTADPSASEETDADAAQDPDPAVQEAGDQQSKQGADENQLTDATAKSNGSNNPKVKITICHATSSASNPYVVNTPNANGDVSGHAGASHQDGRDIIPPFTYNDHGTIASFPGQNWDAAGQEIYSNDCKIPTPPPEPGVPTLSLDPPPCVIAEGQAPTTLAVTIEGLAAGKTAELRIAMGDWSDTVTVTENGVQWLDLNGLGDYVVTLTYGDKVVGSSAFTVEMCSEPEPEIVDFCHGPDDDGNFALLTLPSDEVQALHYEAHGADVIPPFQGIVDGVATTLSQNWDAAGRDFFEQGCKQLPPEPDTPAVTVPEVPCLTADAPIPESITATVSGLTGEGRYNLTISDGSDWSHTEQVTGSGDVVLPLNGLGRYSIELAPAGDAASGDPATATFALERCEEPPVVPPVTPKPPAAQPVVHTAPQKLAVTGAPEHGSALGAAALLALAGAGILLSSRRRKAGR